MDKSTVSFMKAFLGVLFCALLVLFGVVCALDSRESVIEKDDASVAYAADIPNPRLPEVTVTAHPTNESGLIMDRYGVPDNIDGIDTFTGRIRFDISDPTWLSSSETDRTRSIYGRLALKLHFSTYWYKQTTTWYKTATETGNSADLVDVTNVDDIESNPNVQAVNSKALSTGEYLENMPNSIEEAAFPLYTPANPAEKHFTITGIYIAGTTWYGGSVSELNLVTDGANVVAGQYYVTRITGTYSYTYYYAGNPTAVHYCRKVVKDGEEYSIVENTEQYATIPESDVNYDIKAEEKKNVPFEASMIGDDGHSLAYIFLQTPVLVGVGDRTLFAEDLRLNVKYDGSTFFTQRVFLYDGSASEYPTDGQHFVYSIKNDTAEYFRTTQGILPSLTNTDFGLDYPISSIVAIGEKLELEWHADALLNDEPLAPEDTLNAGSYYFRIIGTDPAAVYVDSDQKYYALDFRISDLEDSSVFYPYTQEVVMNPISLKVSIKDGIGIKQSVDQNGVITGTAAYLGKYTEVKLYHDQIDTTIPTGVYYELKGNAYSFTTKAKFDSTVFYLKKASAKELFENNLDYLIAEEMYDEAYTEWIALGGGDIDWSIVRSTLENGSGSLFSFDGSYFPDYSIKAYDSVYLCLSIGISEIKQNYRVELGYYNEDDEWSAYPQRPEDSSLFNSKNCYLEKSGLGIDEKSSLDGYYVAGSFQVLPPEITLNFSNFKLDRKYYYGEICSTEDIDFSQVYVTGDSVHAVDNPDDSPSLRQTYDIDTSEANWRVKIVKKESDMKVLGGNNYVFIYLRLGKVAGPTDVYAYQANDEDQTGYTLYNKTMYAGESLEDDKDPLGTYYIIYTVYYMKAGETSPTKCDAAVLGKAIASTAEGNSIVTISMDSPTDFYLNPLPIRVNMTKYATNKYYDGTTTVFQQNGNKAEYIVEVNTSELDLGSDPNAEYTLSPTILATGCTSILQYDLKESLKTVVSIDYSSRMALFNEGKPEADKEKYEIGCTLSLSGQSGIDLVVRASLINSYACSDILYHTTTGSATSNDVLKGEIYPRTLQMNVLENPAYVGDPALSGYVSEMEYFRSYKSYEYVAIRVARYDAAYLLGGTLLEEYQAKYSRTLLASQRYYADLYYYYDRQEERYMYCFYRELPDLFTEEGQINYEVCYLLLEFVEESEQAYSGMLRTEAVIDQKTGVVLEKARYECFRWDTTRNSNDEVDVVPFNSDMYNSETDIETYDFIDWASALVRDPVTNTWGELIEEYRDKYKVISWDAGLYRLPFTEGLKVANYSIQILTNEHKNVLDDNKRVGFEILKVQLDPKQVFPTVIEEESGEEVLKLPNDPISGIRELVYDKTSKFNVVYTSDIQTTFIDISKHPAYLDPLNGIVVQFGGDPTDETDVVSFANSDTLIVTGFSRGQETDDPSDDETYSVDNLTSDMRNMTLAGVYTLTIRAPETKNYKMVEVSNVHLTVYCANVHVYATDVIRTYMSVYLPEKETGINEDNSPYVFVPSADMGTYIAYIETSQPYDVYPDNGAGRKEGYVFYNNNDPSTGIYDLSDLHVYYVGMMEGDEFDLTPNSSESMAYVVADTDRFLAENGYEDKGGFYEEFFTLSGAKKHNYVFNYHASTLFVKRQNFIMFVDGNQTRAYGTYDVPSEEYLKPAYEVVTEDGAEAPEKPYVFIAAYYAQTPDGYVIYMKDILTEIVGGSTQKIGEEWRVAEMSIDPTEEGKRDYEFYFEVFRDGGTEIDVRRVGSETFFTKDGNNHLIYLIGEEYYYYTVDHVRVKLDYKKYVLYNDGGTHYYYDDNDTRQTLSRAVVPDFDKVVDENRVPYLDVVDGHKIYIDVNHSVHAPTYDDNKNVRNVFYDEDGNKGGYILKVSAEPDSGKGGSTDNYKGTTPRVVIFSVEILDMYLADHTMDTEINPLWLAEFNDSEYTIDNLNAYYHGVAEGYPSVALGQWATVEVEVIDNIRQFMYAASDADNLFTDGVLQFMAYRNGVANDFVFAQTSDSVIKDAGYYMILVKATIKTSYANEGEAPVDMRRNIRFATRSTQCVFDDGVKTPDSADAAYFVLFVVIDRSSDIVINLTSNANRASAEEGSGLTGAYQKAYDQQEVTFSLYDPSDPDSNKGVLALKRPTACGEILNSRSYLSKTDDYTRGYVYFLAENGTYSNVWEERVDINLIHVNEFYLTVIVNFDDRTEAGRLGKTPTYNGNYVTVMQVYKVNIIKKILSVYIMVKETDDNGNVTLVTPTEANCGKYYGEANSDVESALFGYTYGEIDDEVWLADKAELEPKITAPSINWELVRTVGDDEGRYVKRGSYGITPMGGSEPKTEVFVNGELLTFYDYEFDYNSERNNKEAKSRIFYVWSVRLHVAYREPYKSSVVIDTQREYEGQKLRPIVYVYGWDEEVVYYKANEGEVLENVTINPSHAESFNDISITLLGKIYEDKYDPTRIYTFEDINDMSIVDRNIDGAANSGHYLFRIHVGDSVSLNYLGLEEDVIWVYTIEKSTLKLYFVDENGKDGQGFAEMTYGTVGDYPTFLVRYDNFKGSDDRSGNKDGQNIKYGYDNISQTADLSLLNLFNPIYVFVNEQGDILKDASGNYLQPSAAGMYYIDLIIEDGVCGYSDNYNIEVMYAQDENGQRLYPEMRINRRKVGVMYTDSNVRITKEYNARDNVITNSVSPSSSTYEGNYSFSGLSGDTGLVPGDTIALHIYYENSRYARSSVFDENDEMTPIIVYLSFDFELEGEDKDNYELDYDGLCNDLGTKYEDGENKYIRLWGTITQARATIRFLNDSGQSVTTYRIVYNGEPRHANISVEGVTLYNDRGETYYEELTYENGDYTIWYTSERSNWDSDIAPTNCDTYEVTVTITNKNYYETPSTSYLEIQQADVEIVFGGDGIQMYGNVTNGLTAVATGVHDYNVSLGVTYYYINADGSRGDLVEDISVAPTGTYLAVAYHAETDNFAAKSDSETLTIARREMEIKYDVAPSYKYSGRPVSVVMYFEYQGEKYYPQLIFDRLTDGLEWVAVNYTETNGEIGRITSYPSSVGTYRVRAYEVFGNFTVSNPVWVTLTIEKAGLTIRANDTTVVEGETVTVSAGMLNNLTDESVDSVVSQLSYKFYHGVSGQLVAYYRYLEEEGAYAFFDATNVNRIDWHPEPGSYRIECFGGTSKNYTLSYQFGILTVNKKSISVVSQTGNSSTEDNTPKITMEGSFPSDMSVNVTETKNTQYAPIMEAFNDFKQANEEFSGYRLQNVYVFEYVNYSTTSANGTITIKIYLPDLFASSANAAPDGAARTLKLADDGQYYVAILADDGTLSIAEGKRDGDYLSFDSSDIVIKAVSVLTNEEMKVDSRFDWMLYVGIAIGVALIALAIVIVMKKA